MNKLLTTIAFLSLSILPLSSHSQTDAIIDQTTGNAKPLLESEYVEELDKWMLQAYEGDREAQFKVGVLFTNDQFKSADFEQSVYWYKQAARQGHAPAQYNLGHQYLTGSGVKRSETEAMKWWLKAAEQDHPLAQFNIGRAYYLGIGLKEDHAQSRLWFERAAKNNEPKSIDILTQLGWSKPGEYKNSSEVNASTVAVAESPLTENDPQTALEGNQASTALPSAGSTNAETNTSVTEKPSDLPDPISDAVAKTDLETNSDTNTVGLPETQVSSPSTANTFSRLNTESQASNAGLKNQGEEQTTTSKQLNTPELRPIAVYTDPNKRSVLIAIVNDRKRLQVNRRTSEWTEVTNKDGFPVWIHRDYIVVADDIGTIRGNAVNARSVPLITNGTIVGRLRDGDTVAVIDRKKAWFRVISPSHFIAWVKTDEYYRKDPNATEDNRPENQQAISDLAPEGTYLVNDNEWLFSQPADGYTLQLASFDDPIKVAEFRSRSKFVNNPLLHSFTSNSKNIEWTYFLYGAYRSAETAKQTRVEIKQKLAWVRSFGKLQQNRCLAWKKQLPTPKELNKYCS